MLLLCLFLATPLAAQENAQTSDGRRLVDRGHGFELYRLDGRWRLLGERDVAPGHPRALAGLLDPAGLPVAGCEQAAKLLDPAHPGNNDMMPGWR